MERRSCCRVKQVSSEVSTVENNTGNDPLPRALMSRTPLTRHVPYAILSASTRCPLLQRRSLRQREGSAMCLAALQRRWSQSRTCVCLAPGPAPHTPRRPARHRDRQMPVPYPSSPWSRILLVTFRPGEELQNHHCPAPRARVSDLPDRPPWRAGQGAHGEHAQSQADREGLETWALEEEPSPAGKGLRDGGSFLGEKESPGGVGCFQRDCCGREPSFTMWSPVCMQGTGPSFLHS